MNPPVSLPSSTLNAPHAPYPKVDAVNRLSKNSVSRFKRMADSTNQKFAAELLLQMRRIATDELSSASFITKSPSPAAVHLISPMQRPKATKFVSRCLADIRLPNSPSIPYTPRMEATIHLHQDAPSRIQEEVAVNRFRAVSIGGVNDLEVPALRGNVSPLHLDTSIVTVPSEDLMSLSIPAAKKPVLMPIAGASTMKHLEDRWNSNNASSHLVSAKCSFESDNEDEEMTQKSVEEVSLTVPKRTMASTPTKKYVGDALAPGVTVRDVLRKKFSWKSFPELEAYLISHRIPYLACSNAMNYTKAQKQYNNELTQGLLDLAAKEGYVFEGFSFAMVRDRIRCFYKSFVQATKKKKRPGVKTTTAANGAVLAKRVRADTA
jgi:hypothetical protein